MSGRNYKTWREILNYNVAMLSTDYPVLQMDELEELMQSIVTLRLYFSIKALSRKSGRQGYFSPRVSQFPVEARPYPRPAPINPEPYPSPAPINPEPYPRPAPINPEPYPRPAPINPGPYQSQAPVSHQNYMFGGGDYEFTGYGANREGRSAPTLDYYQGGVTDLFLRQEDGFDLSGVTRSELGQFLANEQQVISSLLKQYPNLLAGFSPEDFLGQLPTVDQIFTTYQTSPQSNRLSLRDLTEYLKRGRCLEPRRMITLEGVPLLAAPRLAFGGEWYGDIRHNPTPNFVARLQNCLYLIEIAGARKYITFEHPTRDNSKTSDLFSWVVARQAGKNDFATSQGYIKMENLAWNVATALRRWQWSLLENVPISIFQRPGGRFTEEAEMNSPLLDTAATVAQLDKWLSVESGMFRHKAFGRNYLASGDNPYNDEEWNTEKNKGHLFASDFETDEVVDDTFGEQMPKYLVKSKDLIFGEPGVADFRNIGIIDYTAPSQSQVTEILAHTEFATRPKGKVFMHCAGGWGRTGMGLLLGLIYLFNISWNSALTLMYQLYKRQSVEEVEHLLTNSIRQQGSMKRLFSAIQSQNQSALNEMLASERLVSISDQLTPTNLLTVKAELKPQYGGTVTYHSLVIPKFQSWVKKYLEELGGLDSSRLPGGVSLTTEALDANRIRSIQFGRPIPRYKGRHYVDEGVFLSEISSHPNRNYRNFEGEVANLTSTQIQPDQLYVIRERLSRQYSLTSLNTGPPITRTSQSHFARSTRMPQALIGVGRPNYQRGGSQANYRKKYRKYKRRLETLRHSQ